ncbi:MAG: hypothetical protein DWQ47_06275 [Acidobacteria bacterium]|nr:MAG: hypothetical protein DWQ32_09825 [Acidobacteriota bacterium]REK01981.1 MAG: hypothetical protein DWQ38_06260 [Acidobacteriota bacterium]REK14938.1 MAG: hypothetical protein DWQ43_15515 [Acidobacteriota bacterium]REK45652.1 MAG: hypothetical protein DWQ47_06275 [Acidobacteriota bacterium]
MKVPTCKEELKANRKDEQGAAMVMVLLVVFLLLVACAGLILESALNSANVTDAVAEQQAYHAAESGIQRTLDVLRGNVPPNPLLDSSESASHLNNKIDYSKALALATSNSPGDTSTVPRLSRWVTYDGTLTDRIPLGPNANELAYSIELIDPDNAGSLLSFQMSANINGMGNSYTFGSGGNTATISFVSNSVTDLNTSAGSVNTNLGYFKVATTGSGATLPDDIRFVLDFRMTKPYSALRSIRGSIYKGTFTNNSVGTASVQFDSIVNELMGCDVTFPSRTLNLNPPNTSGGNTTANVSVTGAEPIRILVRSTGFGPRGASKQLEAVVRKSLFDGLRAPATLMLVGDTPNFNFSPGNSANVAYSGEDVAIPNTIIPPVGTTNDTNLNTVWNEFNLNGSGFKGDLTGLPANVNDELPAWLRSTYNLDSVVRALREAAQLAGRYFPSGTNPGHFGNGATGTGITFCDGDCQLSGSGGGILISTGKLTLKGNFTFNGMIIVTGPDGLLRNGGGNGTLQGNAVVAPYDPNNLAAGFMSPKYAITGGGNSTMVYNSSSLNNGLVAVSNFVLGVAEK